MISKDLVASAMWERVETQCFALSPIFWNWSENGASLGKEKGAVLGREVLI